MSSRKTARRLNRILGMLPWVIANPGATVDEVCDRFAYTRRQLVTDLNLVFVCGLPGYGPGDLMVAEIHDDEVIVEMADYFSAPLRLTPPEALSLLAAGMALASTGQAPEALDRAVEKLSRVVLPEGSGALAVDLAEPPLVGELRTAAAEGIAVEIVYTALAGDVTTTRIIEPWIVFSALGNWYVTAWCRLAVAERVFRIDRIRSVAHTADRFEPPVDPPPPAVEYTPDDGDVTAVIRLSPAARWVVDYYPVDILEEEADGSMVIRFRSADATVAARLLIRLGGDASLQDGAEVRRARDDLKSGILARYSDQGMR